jgi:hypothetical protein
LTFQANNEEHARRRRGFKDKLQCLEQVVEKFFVGPKQMIVKDALEHFICPHKYRDNSDASSERGYNSDESLTQGSFGSDNERQRRLLDSDSDECEAQYG